MRSFTFLLAMLGLGFFNIHGQSVHVTPDSEAGIQTRTQQLLFDLRFLEVDASKLDDPLVLASAKSAIANASWALDRSWAKRLLSEAFQLTIPDRRERAKDRLPAIGTDPQEPTEAELDRLSVRNGIMSIAWQDRQFAEQLLELAREDLGSAQRMRSFSALAESSLAAGDLASARDFILRAIEAEPTQLQAGFNILNLALTNRTAADELIIQYTEILRGIHLSENSASRAFMSLELAVFPDHLFGQTYRQAPPAGREAVRAYLSFVIDTIDQLERRETGSAVRLRNNLFAIWPSAQRFAPDMIEPFMALAGISRGAGPSVPLPSMSQEERNKLAYDEAVKQAVDTRNEQDLIQAIGRALMREEFDQARKLIDLLPEGPVRMRELEGLNLRESLALALRGDLAEASGLARQLDMAKSILRVYPVIIRGCVTQRDIYCAASLTREAVRRVEQLDAPQTARVLSELGQSIAPLDEVLALELLDQTVMAANKRPRAAKIDYRLFAVLAPRHESRVREAANSLRDRFERVMALATVYRWNVGELAKPHIAEGLKGEPGERQ